MKKKLLSCAIALSLVIPAAAQADWTHGAGSGFQYEGGIDLGPKGSISYHCSLTHGVSILVPGKHSIGKANILVDGRLLGPVTLAPYEYSDSSIFDVNVSPDETGYSRQVFKELLDGIAAGRVLTVQRPDGTVLAEYPLSGSARIEVCQLS